MSKVISKLQKNSNPIDLKFEAFSASQIKERIEKRLYICTIIGKKIDIDFNVSLSRSLCVWYSKKMDI
jgi:hypothetical protein